MSTDVSITQQEELVGMLKDQINLHSVLDDQEVGLTGRIFVPETIQSNIPNNYGLISWNGSFLTVS